MSCRFTGTEDVEVQFGGYRDGFELVIEREGLARLVRLGQEALAANSDDDMTEFDVSDELVRCGPGRADERDTAGRAGR